LKFVYQLTHDDLSVEVQSFEHIFDRNESLHLLIIARTLAFAPEPSRQSFTDFVRSGAAICNTSNQTPPMGRLKPWYHP
jgi:hypothetical protein